MATKRAFFSRSLVPIFSLLVWSHLNVPPLSISIVSFVRLRENAACSTSAVWRLLFGGKTFTWLAHS